LTILAHDAETLVNQLKPPLLVRRNDIVTSMYKFCDAISDTLMHLQNLHDKIYGKEEEERAIRLPKERINTIHQICSLITDSQSDFVKKLVEECMTLSWKPLITLTRKYSRAAHVRAEKMDKKIEFLIENGHMLVEPDVIQSVDDSILQIVSNCVVHGIEPTDARDKLCKGIGKIKLSFSIGNDKVYVTIEDDGAGIDTDALVNKFKSENIQTEKNYNELTEEEKVQLIFLPHSSTADTLSVFAGRGIGMDVVKNKIEKLGGSIKVKTKKGWGTSFLIEIPR
jgi:chemotaxis protein histidine kinase CheA